MAKQDSPDHAEVREAMREFYMRSHRALDRLLADSGASLAKVKMMMVIASRDGVRSTDLVEAFGFAPRTITEAIDALERDGLAAREPDPDDRRVKRITLTQAGRDVLDATAPLRCEFGEQLFEVLSTTEMRQLTRLLNRLNARLTEMVEAREDELPPA